MNAVLDEHGMPTDVAHITRERVEAHRRPARPPFGGHGHDAFRSLQQFFRWAVEDGEITESPMRNMRPPKVPEPVTPVLSEDDLKRSWRRVEALGSKTGATARSF